MESIRQKQRLAIMALILEVAGFGALAHVHWLLAVGVFLIIWGQVIINHLSFEEDVCGVLNRLMDSFLSNKMREKLDKEQGYEK